MNEELDVYDDGYVEKETSKASLPKPRLSEEHAQGIAHFIKYNNAIPIVLGVMFLGTTGALAASPEVRGAVYSSTESVKSVDNSYIRNANIDGFPFTVQVTNVREDADSYYVSYSLHTIDLVDSVWRPVDKPMQFSVLKTDLKGQDLGTYTGIQVAQVRDYERYRFTTAQQEERKKGPSSKVIATEYHGLIGAFLGPQSETLPGYEIPETQAEGNAVIEGSDPNRLSSVQTMQSYDANGLPASSGTNAVVGGATADSGTSLDKTPPVVSMLGGSSITLSVGQTYTDFGAVATDDYTPSPRLQMYVNNALVSKVTIDTGTPGFYTILYRAEDDAHNVGTATRTVNVISADTTPAPAPTEPPPAP